MEETVRKEEPKVKVSFRQLANCELRYDFTVKGDSVSEVEALIINTKEMIKRQITPPAVKLGR